MPFELANPSAFHWLWIVAAALALAWFAHRRRRRAAARFADSALFARLAPRVSLARVATRALLAVAALGAIAGALLDPRWGVHYEEIQRRGIDVIFVVDVSRSMLASDVKPDRLGRAKQLISDAVDRMAGDRVGLVAFAGVPALASPLTLNYNAFSLSLSELAPQASARGGSLLGDAIRLAADSFTDETKSGKAIVVLTDGEDMDSFPVEAAQKAHADRGIRVYTIGIGDSVDGARIPAGGANGGSWLTHDGQEVWSRMNPDLLAQVALAGGGAFVPAGTAQVDMGQVYDATVAAVGRQDFELTRVKRSTPQFQWLAGAALLLLAAEACLADRRGRGAARTPGNGASAGGAA